MTDPRDERIAELERERDEARAGYRYMVEHAADQKLDGYRELAAKVAKAEQDRDSLREQLAVAQRQIAHLKETLEMSAEVLALAQAERDDYARRLNGTSSFNPGAIATGEMWEEHAKELETKLAQAQAEGAAMRAVLAKTAKWCHSGHGHYPATQCGCCAPLHAALTSPTLGSDVLAAMREAEGALEHALSCEDHEISCCSDRAESALAALRKWVR